MAQAQQGEEKGAGGATFGNPGAAWHVIDACDLNGEGKADILWQNNGGTRAVWLMNV